MTGVTGSSRLGDRSRRARARLSSRPSILLLLGLCVATGQSEAGAPLEAGSSGQIHATAAVVIPRQVLATLPRRVRGSDGEPEDLVNVLIIGSEQDMKLAFQAAEWVSVGSGNAGPSLSRDALLSLSEEAYVARPLHDLYLFGRPQDYGFTHTELVTVVPARHYVRVWRCPSTVSRRALWAGAAAHDSGPWWNSRAGEVSYGMAPDPDSERDFVRDTLRATGLVRTYGYVRFTESDGQAETAAGSRVPTDGRVLAITVVHLPKS